MNKKKKSTNTSPYPDEAIDRLARAFYPAILACWNSEEGQRSLVGARPLHLANARPFGRLKAPLGLSLFRFAPQTRIVYFFVLGAISNMTVTRIYKPYSNQVMVLFQGKLISGWFNANTINAIAIISIIKPRILDIRFFMQSTSLSNWNC